MPALPEAETLELGGITPFSSVDYPGKLAAVLFCQGCPLRCAYCHNPVLQAFLPGEISWSETIGFLTRRYGLLEAVVFSGGEPLAQKALQPALRQVRALGFKTGLHSAGTHPDHLRQLLPDCDWVGLDIKAPSSGYRAIAGRAADNKAFAALDALIEAGMDHEIRTTIDEQLLPPPELLRLAGELAEHGVRRWVLQARRNTPQDPALPFTEAQLQPLRRIIPEILCR